MLATCGITLELLVKLSALAVVQALVSAKQVARVTKVNMLDQVAPIIAALKVVKTHFTSASPSLVCKRVDSTMEKFLSSLIWVN